MSESSDAFRASLEAFGHSNPVDMAVSQGAKLREGHWLEFPYLHGRVWVSHPQGEFRCEGTELTGNERILALQYLEGRGALPPRPPWVSFNDLPGGPHHHALFCEEAIEPLALRFEDRPSDLLEAGLRLGGDPVDLADAAVILTTFPKVQLLVTLHLGGDEFGARANVLFDHNAWRHLPTASLFVLGIEVSRRLRALPLDGQVGCASVRTG